jgi:hypothetical protein
MVEQRPFKALVVGSSPTQPNPFSAQRSNVQMRLADQGSYRAAMTTKSYTSFAGFVRHYCFLAARLRRLLFLWTSPLPMAKPKPFGLPHE